MIGIAYIAFSLKRNLLNYHFYYKQCSYSRSLLLFKGAVYGERILKTIGIQFLNTRVLVMMRERSVSPNYETYDGNDLTPDRKREVTKEIDYANAIDELETNIQYAIEQSLLRRNGESIQYVLERVWNKYLHLVMPDINFNDVETDD